MSFIPATFPRAVRALRPAVPLTQFRCLYTPIQRPAQQQQQHDTTQFASQQRRTFHASPSSQTSVKNPYSVLGVDKSASSSEIKKAYYAAAKKFHPDSSKEPNARERFQEVQSAYEILSDPEKRQQFDQYGEAAFDPNSGGPGGFHPGPGGPFSGFGGAGGFSGFGGGPFGAEFSFEDLFNAAAGGPARGRGRGFTREVLLGEDIEVEATISFMEAAKGTKLDVKVRPQVACSTCSGSGMKKGTKKKECGRCGGTGTRVHFMRGGFQMVATCDSCGGHGVVIPAGSQCGSCDGKGIVRVARSISVDVPSGLEDGMAIRVGGEGDTPSTAGQENAKTKRGDLIVHIRVEPHPNFSRKGSDVFYTSTIPMTTALLGGIIKVPTLEGEVELRVPTGTSTGDRIVMSGMGIKKLQGRKGAKGDLKVEFKVNMPKSLTPSQRTLLELLADEFKDKTARRIMNLSQFSNEAKAEQDQQHPHDESHHGLLKRIWDKLTHNNNQGDDKK